MKIAFKCLAGVLGVAGLLMSGIAGAQQAQSGDLQPRSESVREGTTPHSGGVDVTQPTSSLLPAGIALKKHARTAAVEEAVRDVLRTATVAAIKGDMNKLVEQLSHPDRERLQAEKPVDLNPLTQAESVLSKAFHETYGMTSKFTKDNLAAMNMTVTVGEIVDPAALTNWPLDPLTGPASVTTTQAPTASQGPLQSVWRGAARTASGVINRDYMAEGRDMAVVVLPPAGDIPQLTVSMSHEAIDFWKIDIPDNMDLATLQRNLSDQFGKFAHETGSWPADQDETERLLARRVLIALYDVEAAGGAGSAR